MTISFLKFAVCIDSLILISRVSSSVCWCLDAGIVELGWAPGRCQAKRSDKAGHWSPAMLPFQCRAATDDATRRLQQSHGLRVISDVVCRMPRRLWVTAVAPRSSLQTWISCTLCGQVVEGIGFLCFVSCHFKWNTSSIHLCLPLAVLRTFCCSFLGSIFSTFYYFRISLLTLLPFVIHCFLMVSFLILTMSKPVSTFSSCLFVAGFTGTINFICWQMSFVYLTSEWWNKI